MGTTLLTKGLEFDTVIIVDAHLFSDKKIFMLLYHVHVRI